MNSKEPFVATIVASTCHFGIGRLKLVVTHSRFVLPVSLARFSITAPPALLLMLMLGGLFVMVNPRFNR